jgi:restriction endonuclease S subunit
MNKLPDTWIVTELGHIAHVEMGQSPESRFYNDKGEGLPFFQGKTEFGALYPTVRKWCSEPNKIAEAGNILLSVRAPVGPTNIAVEKCCIGRGLASIRAKESIDQKYLLHYFRHIQPWLSEQGTGSTFAAVSGDFVRTLQVNLAPLPEQKRIADKLDSLLARIDTCRDHLDRIPTILKHFRQSILAAATSGKLTEEWRADQIARRQPQTESGNIARDSAQSRYIVTTDPDSAALHPGDKIEKWLAAYGKNDQWRESDVQSVAKVGTGSTPLRSNPDFFSAKGTPWITSAATSQSIVLSAEEFVTDIACGDVWGRQDTWASDRVGN